MFAVALVVLFAASPSPRVPPSAEGYVFIPRLDKMENLRGFTTLAGKKTPMMKSALWSEELLPALSIDLLSPESLAAAGVDPQGSLTISFSGQGKVACVSLSKPDEFAMRARRWLDRGGPKWTGKLPNTNFYASVREQGVVTGGFVQRGNVGCIIQSPRGSGGALMFEAEKLLGPVKAPASFKNMTGLQGPMLLGSPDAVAVVRGGDTTLTLDARGVKLPISTPTLLPAGRSPYANIPHSGVLTLKARVDPAAIAPYVRSFATELLSYCAGCNSRELSNAIVALSSELTGNLFLRADSMALDPRALRTNQARYFALRHAYFAELKSGAVVKAMLQTLPAIKGLEKTEKGLQLRSEQGTIDLLIIGNHLVIANDLDALATGTRLVLAATPGKTTHSLEAQGDLKPLGKALRKVSVLDALSSKQMAGLFAVGMEFGPLLSSTEKATVWADSGTPMKAQATWVLEPIRAAAQPNAGDGGSLSTVDVFPQATGDGGSGATAP